MAESCGPGVFLDAVLSETFETLVFMVTGKFEKKKFSFECESAEFFCPSSGLFVYIFLIRQCSKWQASAESVCSAMKLIVVLA